MRPSARLAACSLIAVVGLVARLASAQLPKTIRSADGAEMALVSAGEFLMGSEDSHAKPPHRVQLDDFYIDKYEVTNKLYSQFTGSMKRAEAMFRNLKSLNGSSQPIVGVTWQDADAFCRWAGKRLPTEAEWEKAARGEDAKGYPWGEQWDGTRANADNKLGKTAPVGSYGSGVSQYSIHDMAGNAAEWVADWYSEDYYQRSPKKNPPGPESGELKVVRGGSWFNPPYALRSWYRSSAAPDSRSNLIGFRCARSAQ